MPLDDQDVRAASAGLRKLLAAVEAGEVTATADERAHLAGALSVLEQLGSAKGVRATDV